MAHNSVVYLDLFYGLAKIGAILAPLNWRLTAAELSYIVSDCTPMVHAGRAGVRRRVDRDAGGG